MRTYSRKYGTIGAQNARCGGHSAPNVAQYGLN